MGREVRRSAAWNRMGTVRFVGSGVIVVATEIALVISGCGLELSTARFANSDAVTVGSDNSGDSNGDKVIR
ncbi:unnamed protein product [Anisakis simplex]|uniref:Lipoprotein n=1 Tax=Anisakis simplex TaxID=6269 RepID=A0A0M3KA63_ANISI|nr:unnamed protein product [Anisakis simplex]